MTKEPRRHNPLWKDPPEARAKRKREFDQRQRKIKALIKLAEEKTGMSIAQMCEGLVSGKLMVTQVHQKDEAF